MADTDSDEESKTSSLADGLPDSDIYITEHLSPHISATRHHLTGAPEPPEPPYAPSFHPPTGHWTATEKALFFRALSVHSRLRPDLIAASIATKSTLDVAVYLSLLRDGATRANAGTITRDLHPAAHEVSPALVALEEKHAAHLCAVEPAREREAQSEAREEEGRTVKNGMRVRRGQGTKGSERDREGQKARLEAFEQWRGERKVEWAREDALDRLDGAMLQVLDRMLRIDEESRGEADAGSAKEVAREGDVVEGEPSITHHPSAPSSSRHATTPRRSSPLPPTPDDDIEEDYSGAIPSDLSPASRRLICKRLYMRCKRAEASGSTAQLDPARLKPGRKASATSKYKPPRPKDGDKDSNNEVGNPKRPVRGDTRPYKIQRELERLGVRAHYLRANGMDLFHLSALGRLMQLYPRLDASRPQGVADSIAAETIQMLQTLVAQFTRDLVRRAIALRELDFALRAHTKVWRLGERVVRPLHVRRALELCGGTRSGAQLRLNKRTHFEALLERFSEGEESEDDDDDVPLAVRARIRKGKAVVRKEDQDEDEDEDEDENETDDVGEGDQQQRQLATTTPGHGAAAVHNLSSPHRTMYTPFVYAPDLIAPAHPFGVYAPGTTPEPPLPLPLPSSSTLALLCHTAGPHDDDDDYDEEEEEPGQDSMPVETDDEALAVQLRAEALLDMADARAAAVYEAAVWRELRSDTDPGPSRRGRKRRAEVAEGEGAGASAGASAEMSVGGAPHAMRKWKRRKGAGAGPRGDAALFASPDGVRVKSAAIIEDSDSDSEYLG